MNVITEYDPQKSIWTRRYANVNDAIEDTETGGTLRFTGRYNTGTKGPIVINKPIHVMGQGACWIASGRWESRYGENIAWIDNHDPGMGEAIKYDLKPEDWTKNLRIADLPIYHTRPEHYAISMQYMPMSIIERVIISSAYGRGGIKYGPQCFGTRARDVVISGFNEYGVDIEATGNDFAFYNCDIGSRRINDGRENQAIAGINCINAGLTVYQGEIDCQNDSYTGAGVRIYRDSIKRPFAKVMNARLTGVYSEHCDMAVLIDATPGHYAEDIVIDSPHWTFEAKRKATRGVVVRRGKRVVITNPRIYNMEQAQFIADFGDNEQCQVVQQCLTQEENELFQARYVRRS